MINVVYLLWAAVIIMLVISLVSIVLTFLGRWKHFTTWGPVGSILLVLIAFFILVSTFRSGRTVERMVSQKELSEEVQMTIQVSDDKSAESYVHKGYYVVTDQKHRYRIPVDRTVLVSTLDDFRLETYRKSKTKGIFTYNEEAYRLYVPFIPE